MKIKSLIMALIMMMGVLTVNAGTNLETSEAEAAAAPCAINISNSIDCFVPVNIYIDCGSGPMLIMSGQLNPGSWASPTPNSFPLPAAYCPLPPNCRVLLEFQNNGVFAQPGDMYCCGIPSPTPNNCARFKPISPTDFALVP